MKNKGIFGGIIVVVLILVLTLAMGGGSVSAEEPTIIASGNCGKAGSNVTWTLDSTGLLTISGEGEMENYSSVYKNGWITTAPWRNRASTLIIQEGVTSIGNDAFSGCTGLTSVTISDSVISIGESAFEYCNSIEKVHISDVAAWCGIVFKNWSSNPLSYANDLYVNDALVTDLTIPNGVISIGSYAFSGCTSLTSVTIGNGVTSIGYYAFSYCPGLTSVEIPNSVTSIGNDAFLGCTGLTSMTIGGSVTSIGNNAFSDCTGLTSVTIPDSVTSIGRSAFRGCIGLISATIGNSVTSIGRYAFEDCSNLTSVYFNANECADFEEGYNVFSNAGKGTEGMTITFGKNVQNIPSYLCYASKYNTRTEGYDYSSDYAPNVKKIIIADGVQNIGQFAFYGCAGLTSVTIPGSMTSIGSSAFYGCTGLTSVTIPDSVASIGDRAFEDCTGLTSVTIGYSVTSIGRYAFHGCTGLTEILYNAKAAADLDYYSNAFSNAGTSSDGLRAVIGNSVEQIPACLFSDCIGLTSVTIGNSVTSIGRYAFEDCTGLTSVTIPNSVTSIGYCAFTGCTGLTSVTIPDSVTSIGYEAFSGCAGLTSVTIPDSVTSIGWSAFRGCIGLISATIGNSVTSIGSEAFSGCSNLTSVYFNAKECTDFKESSNVFSNAGEKTDGVTITFGKNVQNIPSYLCYASKYNSQTGKYDYSSDYAPKIKKIIIADGVQNIGQFAFYGSTSLTEIIYNAKAAADLDFDSKAFCNAGTSSDGLRVAIGDGVEKIPSYLFYGCTGLTSVTIPDNVTSIGGGAFCDCTGLTSVTIPDNVTSIGRSAFLDCTGLAEIIYNAKAAADLQYSSYGNYVFNNAGTSSDGLRVVIGNGVEKIPSYLFYGCTGLTSVTIGNSVTSIGSSAFYGCTGLTSVTIPDNVTSIGRSAFSDCTGLAEIIYNAKAVEDLQYGKYNSNVFSNAGTSSGGVRVVIGDGVEKIPGELFYGCTGLTSVTIGNSVTSIGSSAFSGCTGLAGATIGDGVISIGGCAFNGCTGLTSVTIPDSVTSIGYRAFEDCTGLTGVTIGNSVTSIGVGAFWDCTGLTSVTIPDSVTSVGADAFMNCTGLTRLIIGRGVRNIEYWAFEHCTHLKEIYYNANAAEDISYSSFYNVGILSRGVDVTFGKSVKKLPSEVFPKTNSNQMNIRSITFTGDAPTTDSSYAFGDLNVCAFYPYQNETWTAAARMRCSEYLNWKAYSDAPVTDVTCKIGATAYPPDSSLDTGSICMTLTHEDGCVETIPYNSHLLELGSYDMSTTGEKVIDVTYKGHTAQLKVYVHEKKAETLDKTGYPESSHDYENDLNKTYTYKAEGAFSLDVTFSAQTEVETNIDYLYVNGTKYTGTELAGKTITISGDTLTIRLVSDKSDSAYGFSIDSIVKTYMGHEYEDTVVPPTCTEQGYTLRSCPCGSVVKQNYVDALGHDMVTDAAVAPTCTKTGLTEGSHCARCDEATTAQKVVPALGHDMVTDAAVAPTCMKTGLTEGSHCSRCDEATTAQKVVPALGHDMVTDAAVAPTCTKTGLTEGSHCSRCDEATTAQKVVPALGHDMVTDAAVAPTCTKTGLTEGSHCARCDEATTAQKVVPALGHDMVTDAAVAPTCMKTGLTEGSHCSRCDEATTAQKVVPALGHDMVTDAAVAPTCTRTGLTEGSHCSRCDEATTAQKVVPALGHDMVTDAAVAPTCTKTGLTEGSHCSRCDDQTTAQKVIPARGHRFNARHICMVCGVEDPVVEITLKKLPTKASYVVNKEALDVAGGVVLSHYESGETEELELTAAMVSGFDNTILGKQTLTVTIGGLTTTFEVEVVERTVISVAVENGKLVKHYTDGTTEETPLKDGAISDFAISETGEKTLTLTSENACVAAYKDADGNYVALKAVANEDGSYSYVVPEEVTEVTVAVKGDLDGDGRINMKDLAQLRRNMAEGTVEGGLEQLLIDFNGDGVVNMKDMGLLRRYLAGGYDIELGW